MGAGLLLVLASAPMLLGFTNPLADGHDAPGFFGLYASGLSSLGIAGLVALPLAVIFAFWLMAGEQRVANRKYLHGSARARVNFVQSLRSFAIIFGAAGLIVGSLAGLYAALVDARPDVAFELPLPFFTFELAVPCLLIGGALYAAGRIGR